MEETVINEIVSLEKNPELIELLNSMCMGAHEVQMGTLLATMQKKIGEVKENSVTMEWIEF